MTKIDYFRPEIYYGAIPVYNVCVGNYLSHMPIQKDLYSKYIPGKPVIVLSYPSSKTFTVNLTYCTDLYMLLEAITLSYKRMYLNKKYYMTKEIDPLKLWISCLHLYDETYIVPELIIQKKKHGKKLYE